MSPYYDNDVEYVVSAGILSLVCFAYASAFSSAYRYVS